MNGAAGRFGEEKSRGTEYHATSEPHVNFFFRNVIVKANKTGLARIIAATGYSTAGLQSVWRSEAAFRQESLLYLVLLPAIFFLPFSLTVKMLLFLTNNLVLIVELVNSAIEAIVDMASPDFHPLAKKAKDIGSATVLIALLTTLGLWIWAVASLFA
jgi:diacylglycerol kinase (ATP)